MFSERLLTLLVLGTLASACAEKVTQPSFGDDSLLIGTRPPDPAELVTLEGQLVLDDGASSLWGDDLALAVTGEYLSLFSSTNVYAVLRAGCRDDELAPLVLEGYWRDAPSTRIGRMQLLLEPPALARSLCGDEAAEPLAETLRLVGWADERGQSGREDFVVANWQPPKAHDSFFVVGHRGGCRTSDGCGASENSLELIRIAERFGVDAIEIDAIATADGVPILYHDEAFSARLVNGTYCYGAVRDFTLAHVRALCTLEYGEKVPTLAEALRTVTDETELGGVWIDIKDARSVPLVIAVTEAERTRAAARGRQPIFVYGLYADEIIDAYRAAEPPPEARCLVELSRMDALDSGCQIWAPRWTRGTLADKVVEAQDDGLLVGFWTLDERDVVDRFLQEARPNAILTNRPWLVYQRYQALGEPPRGPSSLPFP